MASFVTVAETPHGALGPSPRTRPAIKGSPRSSIWPVSTIHSEPPPAPAHAPAQARPAARTTPRPDAAAGSTCSQTRSAGSDVSLCSDRSAAEPSSCSGEAPRGSQAGGGTKPVILLCPLLQAVQSALCDARLGCRTLPHPWFRSTKIRNSEQAKSCELNPCPKFASNFKLLEAILTLQAQKLVRRGADRLHRDLRGAEPGEGGSLEAVFCLFDRSAARPPGG